MRLYVSSDDMGCVISLSFDEPLQPAVLPSDIRH